MLNSAKSTTGITLHGLCNRLILASCAILLALVGCQGPVGPQGSSGPQGEPGVQGVPGPEGPQRTAGQDAYTEVVRIAGHLDGYGRATWELSGNGSQTITGSDDMPLVNIWIRRSASSPYQLVATSELPATSEGYARVRMRYRASTKLFTITLSLPEFGGSDYLMIVVFYPIAVPLSDTD